MLMKAKKETNETTRALQTNARKVRNMGRVYMHASCAAPEWVGSASKGTATITFEAGSSSKATVRTTVEVPCEILRGHTDAKEERGDGNQRYSQYTDAYHPTTGYESFSVEQFYSAVALLPKDARVRIEVSLDAGTNELCVESLVHADRVYLIAEWEDRHGTVRHRFLIDASVSRHNSARFGRGGF